MIDLRLSDPEYTDRLASFLTSLGQNAVVAGPDRVELTPEDGAGAHVELGIYLRVWNVLYPDARVNVESQHL
jgi:hypothetical protein